LIEDENFTYDTSSRTAVSHFARCRTKLSHGAQVVGLETFSHIQVIGLLVKLLPLDDRCPRCFLTCVLVVLMQEVPDRHDEVSVDGYSAEMINDRLTQTTKTVRDLLHTRSKFTPKFCNVVLIKYY
jgi:hypothetical protein